MAHRAGHAGAAADPHEVADKTPADVPKDVRRALARMGLS